MLIDMFCMAFDDLFKTPEDATTAAAIWGTVLRLVPSGLTDNNIESWEFFRQWIGIAQAVFEKGSPTAQVCMLKAWREFIYITAEFPLALESTKLVPIDLIKPIVILTRPLRLLLSPNAAVSEQADEVCMQLLYSCLNPAFATPLNTTELDVFWTDVVETCLRLYLKDGPHIARRRKRALEILAVLFRPNPSSPPNLRSPPRNKIRWAVGRITDDQLKLIEVPALSGLWVKSKSHIIIAALLNTVFTQIDLDTDPWVDVWTNFVTLTFQALYPTPALLRGQRLPDDTYNVLRTVMNGSVQILEEHATRTRNHSDQLLKLLVDAFHPLCPQLLLDNLLFSVSVNGPYILKCASATPGTLQSQEKQAPQTEDTLDLNPVLLLWTIVLKFAPTLRDEEMHESSQAANMSLYAVSEWIASRTQHVASDLVSVIASMMSTPETPFSPVWSTYDGQSGVKSMNQNMESLNAFLRSPACAPSNRTNYSLCKWLTYLTDCIRPLFTLSERESKKLSIGSTQSMTPEQRAAVMPGEECLIFLILSFLEYNADCPELNHRTVASEWNELYNFIAEPLLSSENSPPQVTVAFTKALEFLVDEVSRMKTLDVFSDAEWPTLALVLKATSTTWVYREFACTIVMTLLSRLELWGIQQVFQGKTITYEWCQKATSFIENCAGDGVVGIHLRMVLRNFSKRHTEAAVLKSLKTLVAQYNVDNEENRKLEEEARANVIKYKVPDLYLLPRIPTQANKVRSRFVPTFPVALEHLGANCMLPRAPKPESAPAPIVPLVVPTQEPSNEVKEDHFEEALEQEPAMKDAPPEDAVATQVIEPSFNASISSPTVPVIDITMSPPQAIADSLDSEISVKRVRGRPKRSGVGLSLADCPPIVQPTEAAAADAEPEIVRSVTRTTRSVSAALSSSQESPLKQKAATSTSAPAATQSQPPLSKSDSAAAPLSPSVQRQNGKSASKKVDPIPVTAPTQEHSGKNRKKVIPLRRTRSETAAQNEEVVDCASEDDEDMIVSLQPPDAPAQSQSASTATPKSSNASKKSSRSSRKRRRTRSETVVASASQQDDTDMDESAPVVDSKRSRKKARSEVAQSITPSTTTTSMGIQNSAYELLQALEGYTSLTGSASEDGNVLDKTRVFELETKLMQALIQTRGLVMKMDDKSN